jgi:hypothetical protein
LLRACFNERPHQRRDLTLECRTFRLKQRRDKKHVVVQLDRPQITRRIMTYGMELMAQQCPFELRIYTETAAIAFTNFGRFVRLGDQRAGDQTNAVHGFHQ